MYSWEEGLISRNDFLESLLRDFPIVKNNSGIEYYNIPSAFDIETSSFYDYGEKRSCMYIWQFGIYDSVLVGRTWEEFQLLLSMVSKILSLDNERRIIVYVHNLAYEFQFIRKHFNWDKVFFLDERKPVYALTNGIEFRCSLKLAGGKSLFNVGKDLLKYKCRKMIGDLDYSILRTPLTPLTPDELKYCENDIRVLLCYIQEKIESDGDITKIPLTNTGYVRNYSRKNCFKKWRGYRNLMKSLTITPEEYEQLQQGFQGGFTHANAHYVDKTLDGVSSYDIRSSYPSVMVLEKFPMSKSAIIEHINPKDFWDYLKDYCCLFDLEIYDVEPKLHQDHPISRSKCWVCEGAIVDNGRVVFAERICITVTEQDFYTYYHFYNWDRMSIYNFRIYEKGYLPTPLVESALKFFGDKTELKGDKANLVNYNISKNMLNALFGMMVTNPVRDEFLYEDESFVKKHSDVEKSINKYNDSIKRFLFYPWGVWITAYARANLFSCIAEFGLDHVYSDTDSEKCLHADRHYKYFEEYEREILRKIQLSSDWHHIPIEKFMPVSPIEGRQIIGTWKDEGEYTKFKTLGAKRYLTLSEGEGLVLTLAGANKEKSAEFLKSTDNPFKTFRENMVIDSDHSGRLISTYIDDETEGNVIDYLGIHYHYHELSSVHMEPSEYTLSRSKEFEDYLKGLVDFGE